MAGGTMDFKKEGITGAEAPPEAPPMDLGENLETEKDAPIQHTEHLPSQRQNPVAACDGLQIFPAFAGAAPELCDPGAGSDHQGHVPGEETQWLRTPQEARAQEQAEMGGGQDPRNVLEAFQECPGNWTPDAPMALETMLGASSPPDQGELLMELERDGQAGEENHGLADGDDTAAEADQIQLEALLARLQRLSPTLRDPEDGFLPASDGEENRPLLRLAECQGNCAPCPLHIATGHGLGDAGARQHHGRRTRGLLLAETDSEDLLNLLQYEGGVPSEAPEQTPLACSDAVAGSGVHRAYRPAKEPGMRQSPDRARSGPQKKKREAVTPEEVTPSDAATGVASWEGSPEPIWRVPVAGLDRAEDSSPAPDTGNKTDLTSFPDFKEVPGPCDPEDLLDGVIFGAKYLGSTQLLSERNPPSSVRMSQAQEAVDRVKAPDGESQPMTEVDLFISTQRIKVLTADSQEAMMDHPLQTISYIADIGSILVLMARRKVPRRADAAAEKRIYKMICHIFRSADAPVIARAIGQAFSVAYRLFLHSSDIQPSQLHPRRCSDADAEEEIRLPTGEEMYNGDLAHFSKQENCKEVIIPKQKGEILGVVIVESGWGSILPTVVIANLMHRGAAERSGKLSIGDRIMSINGTSLVGLPLATCQNIIRDLKSHTEVTLNVVHCPPVTTALVRRPDTKYPLGFCVENGIICSLMRGGIAERGGVRVGHRIIEINGQSVVAMPHEKIIRILQEAVSEVRIKTMPASTYRLLTGQEQPIFL